MELLPTFFPSSVTCYTHTYSHTHNPLYTYFSKSVCLPINKEQSQQMTMPLFSCLSYAVVQATLTLVCKAYKAVKAPLPPPKALWSRGTESRFKANKHKA